jgi:phytoene dehydrogenase-like protein
MPDKAQYDAIIVGSGPNGLAAAITVAEAGLSTLVLEAKDTVGGGMRTKALTLPGFAHDVCSSIHPLNLASPFFRKLNLEQDEVEWIHPSVPMAHPFSDGTAVLLDRSTSMTSEMLGKDGPAYRSLIDPLVENWEELVDEILGPFPLPPKHPFLMARFALNGLRSVTGLAQDRFKGRNARALFAGLGAHSILPLDKPTGAAFGMVLGTLGHAVGWPLAKGGSQVIADAMAARLRALGGEIITGCRVSSIDQLPAHRILLLDITPKQLLELVGERLPAGYRRQMQRYRYGPGVFKIDWALVEPIPWKANECLRAATVHLGGEMEAIAQAESTVWRGEAPEEPFVILAQPSIFDQTRVPVGKQLAWAYCHVPNGCKTDMTERIEAQIERFAPGFRQVILERSQLSPVDMQAYNENYVGGDINGGVQDMGQLFTRPTMSLTPYRTPVKGMYICSSSTPPGGGVHGMCGYHAALTALIDLHLN